MREFAKKLAKERIEAESEAGQSKLEVEKWKNKYFELEQKVVQIETNMPTSEIDYKILLNENINLKQMIEEKKNEFNKIDQNRLYFSKEKEKMQDEIKNLKEELIIAKNRFNLAEKKLDFGEEFNQNERIQFEILKIDFKEKILENNKFKDKINYLEQNIQNYENEIKLIQGNHNNNIEIVENSIGMKEEIKHLKKISEEFEIEQKEKYSNLEKNFERQKILDQKNIIEMGVELNEFRIEVKKLIEINQLLENEILKQQKIIEDNEKKCEYYKNEIAKYREKIQKVEKNLIGEQSENLKIKELTKEVKFFFFIFKGKFFCFISTLKRKYFYFIF